MQNVTNKDDGTTYYKTTEPFNERNEEGKRQGENAVREAMCVSVLLICRSGHECKTVTNSVKCVFLCVCLFVVSSVLTPCQLTGE